MKNMIIALSGCLMLTYLTLSVLSIYRLTICRNELDQVLSDTVYSVLDEYCMGGKTTDGSGLKETAETTAISDQEAENLVIERIRSGLTQLSDPEIIIYACSMKKGILSVEVTGNLAMPAGTEKKVSCRRTAIWDRKGEN